MFRIFLSYAKEDRDRVTPCYKKIKAAGYQAWMDVEDILPGQNWEAEIERAFSDAHIIILFLSAQSVSKRGFVQREANDAIERLRYKQPTDIYVIPVLLETCEVPSQIARRLQYVDLNSEGAWEQILSSLALGAKQQKIEVAEGVVTGPFKVFTLEHRERWDGQPGHTIEVSYPRFSSEQFNVVAKELTDYFCGRKAKVVIESRQKPWTQSPDLFGERGETALDGRWDDFGINFANDAIISLTYNVGWYGAGAAHPNSHFETFNFWFSDRLVQFCLEDLFSDHRNAIRRVSDICIRELTKQYWDRTGEVPSEKDIEEFQKGASPEWANFSAFAITGTGLVFHFCPYQVGPYALGSWSVEISFFDLLDVLVVDGIHTKALPAVV